MMIEEVVGTLFVRSVPGLFEVHLDTLPDPRVGILVSSVHSREDVVDLSRKLGSAIDLRMIFARLVTTVSVELMIILRVYPPRVNRAFINRCHKADQACAVRTPGMENVPSNEATYR
jgi:hypothetical protein